MKKYQLFRECELKVFSPDKTKKRNKIKKKIEILEGFLSEFGFEMTEEDKETFLFSIQFYKEILIRHYGG
jgi:hypothetical protein